MVFVTFLFMCVRYLSTPEYLVVYSTNTRGSCVEDGFTMREKVLNFSYCSVHVPGTPMYQYIYLFNNHGRLVSLHSYRYQVPATSSQHSTTVPVHTYR